MSGESRWDWTPTVEKKCRPCRGKGFYKNMWGEKEYCSDCHGTGKVIRQRITPKPKNGRKW